MLIKMLMKVLSLYLTKQNVLIVQDLWQNSLSNLFNNLTERIHKIKCKDCGINVFLNMKM